MKMRLIKTLVRRAEIHEALQRDLKGESPLPDDKQLIREGALRKTKLIAARHLREERKYAKQPPEKRIRYDFGEQKFYRERREICPTLNGGFERRLVRNYIEASYEPEYLHAMTLALGEFEAEQEATQRIIDFFNEESDTVKDSMSALGTVGGKVKSEAKSRAARQNGKRGGRPKKIPNK